MKYGLISECRSCRSSNIDIVFDLGHSPLADRLLTHDQLHEDEPRYPLELAFCHSCGLSQITYTVPPEELFCSDYPYFSSVSNSFQTHAQNNVAELIEGRHLSSNSFVIELASNDGYLLKHYHNAGIPVLGFDPAEAPADAANAIGVTTRKEFFTRMVAEDLVRQQITADVVHANNILAHVPDLNGFVAGIAMILKPGGMAILEVPYVRDLIERNEFDTIYHQHLCYFSVTSLDRLFRRHGLCINSVHRIPVHGGSLRLYVEASETLDASVKKLLDEEEKVGLTNVRFYQGFGKVVGKLRTELMDILRTLRDQGRTLAAYGAPAKGCTLTNCFGIETNLIPYTVDKNLFKQGRFMPGTRQPILSPRALLTEMPDFVLLLAWNLYEEILGEQEEYRSRGGQFVIPLPRPRIA